MDLILLGIAAIIFVSLIVALVRRERRMELADGIHTLPKSNASSDTMLLPYIACYGLLVLLIGVSIAMMLMWADTVMLILAAFAYKSDWSRLLYIVLICLGAIVLFGFVIIAETYLRTGVRQGQLLRRFLRLCLIIAAMFVFNVLVRLGIQGYLRM